MSEPTPHDPAPTGISINQQIRWGDLDALGHVNNIIFFQFCESARIAYFDAIGLEQLKQRPTDGPGMVSGQLNFRRQLRYPGNVQVSAHVTKIGQRSFTLTYELRDAADAEIVADGDSVCVWVDYAAGRALPLPDELVAAIARIEQDDSLRQRS